jgi:isopenicillin-N epimerase
LTERKAGRGTQSFMNAQMQRLWSFDHGIDFLNHGSFGACPGPVLDFQRQVQQRLERQPIRFFLEDCEPALDEARSVLGRFLKASPADLVFVPNATAGVNTVLRSLPWRRGDELLVTDHAYNACRNALDFVAARAKARVVTVAIPFPLRDASAVMEPILEAVTSRTRLALLDHVTSPTALVLPIAELVRELDRRGVETLVDGAHAPGMLPLDLTRLGAAYYTGNCHKWICAPKGAGFLHVRGDRQARIRPLSISHGANSPRRDRSRFQLEFGWTGTADPSPYLCVPEAIRVMGGLVSGGWRGLMRRNRELALAARGRLCRALSIEPPCPESMLGSLAAIPLPDQRGSKVSRFGLDPLNDRLWKEFRIEVPVFPWPAAPKRLLRISAQLYNHEDQYERLAQALIQLLT